MSRQLTIPQAIDLALNHHRAGRFAAAEMIYRQILAAQPEHGDALYLLGTLAHQTGHTQQAIELLQRAIAVNPAAPQYQINLGQMLLSSGNLDEAERVLLAALEQSGNSAEARMNLGAVYRQQGRANNAIEQFRQAVHFAPNLAIAHNGLGDALQMSGQLEAAIAVFGRAMDLDPNFPDAPYNLGNALSSAGRIDEAIAAYAKALSIKPDFIAAMSNLGTAMKKQGKLNDAIALFERAVTVQPDFAEGWNNLSNALHEAGRFEKALFTGQRAVAIRPDYAEAHNNAGNALHSLGRLSEATECYRKAISLQADFPDAENGLATSLVDAGHIDEGIDIYQRAIASHHSYAPAHYNLALTLLLKGDFANGWREHEWRSKLPERLFPDFGKPQWDGSELAGRSILLHTEQGFGDAIQFARYVALVHQRGAGQVILQCQPELLRLLKSLNDPVLIVPRGEALPEFDTQCPLMSLPLVFKTTQETIPATVPYLHAESQLTENWKQRIEQRSEGKLKVGLAWAGRAEYANDRNRSIKLETLSPLAELSHVQLFSLQKDRTAEHLSQVPAGMNLVDWTSELTDFAQTAGLIANLDLVISVDTAVAHLAAALGKRTWIMLPYVPDWRWMLEREDSPWYPTVRLFRQTAPMDWTRVIERMGKALRSVSP